MVNHKIYIGKTEKVDPFARWKEHLTAAKRKVCNHRALYRAINKYGKENFSFTILEETDNCEEREIYYINLFDTYNNGYNETLGGDGKKRLQLDEEAVCTYYLTHTLRATKDHFGVDKDSINKILHKNGVQKKTNTEANRVAMAKKVNQLDLVSGKIICTHVSTAEAEKTITGKNNHGANVSRVCRGERKQYAGYGWEYAVA